MARRFENPFPGLRPFEAGESHLFFGRNGQCVAIIDKLEQTRFVGVVGTSGSGKSSLVRAGLLPQLEGGLMASAGSCWRFAVMKPGDAPLRNLAQKLAAPDVLGENAPDPAARAAQIEAVLRRGSLGLVQAVEQARLDPDDNLLVVVDQFEELFRMARLRSPTAADEAAAFVAMLLQAARQTTHPIYIVLTMRSDFLGDCAQFRDLPEALNRGQYLVPRMSRDELRSAIEGPVAVGGATITPRLVQELLNVVGDDPDQLPVLQHALMRTWDTWAAEGRPNEPLDLAQFRSVGALQTALSKHADEVLAGLTAAQKEVARRLFQRLCERGSDARETRRATRLDELCAVANPAVGAAAQALQAQCRTEVQDVIEQFRAPGRTFLMPPPGVALAGDTVIDISHEALIRQWTMLRGWVETEANSGALYRRLAEAAERGDSHWRGRQLQAALDWKKTHVPTETWAARYHPGFAKAMDFLEDSRLADRRQWLWRRGVTLLVPLLLLAGGVGWKVWSDNQDLTAANHALQTKAKQLAEKTEQISSQAAKLEKQRADLALYAERMRQQNDELERLRKKAEDEARNADHEATKAKAESARAQVLGREATASKLAAQSLLEGDGETAALLAVEALGVSRTEETVAAMWKALARPATLQPLRHPGRRLLAIGADARHAATIGASRDLVYWDLAQGRQLGSVQLPHAKDVNTVAVAARGDQVVVGGEAPHLSVYRWGDGALHALPLPAVQPHGKPVRMLRLAANGHLLASADGDGVIALWDLAAGIGLRHTLVKGSGEIDSMAFDADGRWLAAALRGTPRQVLVWDTVSGRELLRLPFTTTPTLQFARDALVMLADGVLSVRRGPAFDTALEADAARNMRQRSFFVGPKGRNIYANTGDGALMVWSIDGDKLVGRNFPGVARLAGLRLALPETSQVDVLAESGDAQLLAFAVHDASPLARLFNASRSPPYLVVTSDAAAGASRVFNLPRQRVRSFLGTSYAWPRVQQLVFADHGRQLVVATADEILRFDLSDGGVRADSPQRPLVADVIGLALGAGAITAYDDSITARRQPLPEGDLVTLASDDRGKGQGGTRPRGAAQAPDGSGFVLAPVQAPAPDSDLRTVGLAWVGADGRRVDMPVPALPAAGGTVDAVAAAGGGRRLAWALQGSKDRAPQLQVWDTESRALLHTVPGWGSVFALALSRDGQRLAAVVGPSNTKDVPAAAEPTGCGAPGSMRLRVWDLSGGGAPREGTCRALRGDKTDLYRVEFTPSGRATLVANRDDGELQWQAWPAGERGAPETAPRLFDATVHALAATEKQLATFDRTRGLLLHDLSAPGKLSMRLAGSDTGLLTLAFTPDARLLLGGAGDGSIYVWNAADGSPRARLRFGHRRSVSAFAFDASGQTLASGDRGGSVALWSVPALRDLPDVTSALCAQASRNIGMDAWRTYLKDAPYRRTCPGVPPGDGVVDGLLVDAWQRADAGDVAGARRLVVLAVGFSDGVTDAPTLRSWCRRAVLAGAGAEAMPLCERAVAAPLAKADAREARAIALALRGRHAEAAADLRAVVADDALKYSDRVLREEWLRQLGAGRNPFNSRTLQSLRAGG